jgi:hypothetical protein
MKKSADIFLVAGSEKFTDWTEKRENCIIKNMQTEATTKQRDFNKNKTINNEIKDTVSISKQARVLEIVENEPNTPISKAMVACGYSETTARNPSRYIGRENLLKAFAKAIPDKLILKAHKKLLKAKKQTKTYVKGQMKTEVISEDAFALSKGVELAYRVKGSFAPEEKELTVKTGLEAKDDNELDEIIRQNEQLVSRAEQFKPKPDVIEGEFVANTTQDK